MDKKFLNLADAKRISSAVPGIAKLYEAAGFQILDLSKLSSLVHFSALREKQRGAPAYHMVRVVTEDQLESDKATLVRNQFVQNAFSNSAVPIYALMGDKKLRFMTADSEQYIKIKAAAASASDMKTEAKPEEKSTSKAESKTEEKPTPKAEPKTTKSAAIINREVAPKPPKKIIRIKK